MSPRIRKLLLMLVMLWLPLQNAWSAISPLCQHHAKVSAVAVGHAADHEHSAHQHHDQDRPQQSTDTSPFLDHLGQCHHSSMFAIPGFTAGLTLNADTTYTESASAHFFQFVPEQPQRPPLA